MPQFCCNGNCVDPNPDVNINDECCVNDDCANVDQICCPVPAQADETEIEFKCRTGNCCNDADCPSNEPFCINNNCNQNPSDQCFLNWDTVVEIIDADQLDTVFEFDIATFGHFPEEGDSFYVSNFVSSGANTCDAFNECTSETGCETCTNPVYTARYQVFFCYNSNCYILDISIPRRYIENNDYDYRNGNFIVDRICNSYQTLTTLDENTFKCLDGTDCVDITNINNSCQRIDGVSHLDLPMTASISESNSTNCPCDCKAAPCQTNNCALPKNNKKRVVKKKK